MDFEAWEQGIAQAVRDDPAWGMRSYRLALFLIALAWNDSSQLARDRRTRDVAGQLYSAISSVGANLAEGYSKDSGRDQARFYEYALGSVREAVVWYYAARHVLGPMAVEQRLRILAELRRLLTATIRQQRQRKPGQPQRSQPGGPRDA